MLFQLLTGKLPFPGRPGEPMAMLLMHINDPLPSPKALAPDLPASVDRLVTRCMAKDPAARPDIDELARLFTEAVQRTPLETRAGPSSTATRRPASWPRAGSPMDAHALTTKTAYPPSPAAGPRRAEGRDGTVRADGRRPARRPPPPARLGASPPARASPRQRRAPAGEPASPLAPTARPRRPIRPHPQTSSSWVRSILDKVFRGGPGNGKNSAATASRSPFA